MNEDKTDKEFVPINKWAEDDRPREKLSSRGRQALSNAELLAILIGSGSKNESAVQLSQRILHAANNNLIDLSKFSIKDLCKFKGVGEAKAITIIAAMELGNRISSATPLKRFKIHSSNDAYRFLQGVYTDLTVEEFHVLLLNQANEIIKHQSVSKGGITATVVDTRVIAKHAIEHSAVSVVLSHNHPSGNMQPSQSDISLTKKLKDGLALLDIKLLDHVIVGFNTYYSFADEGKL